MLNGLTAMSENHFVNQLQLAAQDLAAHVNVRKITWGPQGISPGSAVIGLIDVSLPSFGTTN